MGGALIGELAKGVAVSKATETVTSQGSKSSPSAQPAAGARGGKPGNQGGSSGGSLLSGVTKVAPSPGKAMEKFKPGGALGGNKVLIAEFIVCMIIVGVGPLVGTTSDAVSWLKKGAAVSGMFLVLSLIASGGPRASKISAAFGGLVTLALLINSHEVFNAIIGLLTAAGGGGGGGDEESDPGIAGEAEGEE